jgi:hypothetical protein
MNAHSRLVRSLIAALIIPSLWPSLVPACCPAPPAGKPVVNADQTVILIWDPASKTEHFIRQASFKSDAEDFGFLVPTPAQPELEESGNNAFPYLRKLTEPERKKVPRPSPVMACTCSALPPAAAPPGVTVLQEKLVAGFHAAVIEAASSKELVRWLRDHGYAFSPEVEAWASPYVEAGWKITALRVAKDKERQQDETVAASSLRISFKTDRPLFPYREPDPEKSAAALGARHRLLRIYFLAEARYRGELTQEVPWTGTVAWANRIGPEDRKQLLAKLNLPETAGPAEWWLTEFEDDWPYRAAPADVTFSRDADQGPVKRPPILEYTVVPLPTDVTAYAILAIVAVPPLWRRFRGRRRA